MESVCGWQRDHLACQEQLLGNARISLQSDIAKLEKEKSEDLQDADKVVNEEDNLVNILQ